MNEAERRTAEGILYTDQYQLTMAQLYFRMGLHEKPAQFDHFFRRYPDYGSHKAGYGPAVDALDAAVGPMDMTFNAPALYTLGNALG